MDRSTGLELDRLIEAVYAAGFELEWQYFRPEVLRLLCAWAGAEAAAWLVLPQGGSSGEFASWPGALLDGRTLATLSFDGGARERTLSVEVSRGRRREVLVLRVEHRGSHLHSVIALLPGERMVDLKALRHALGHVVQAGTLALRQFVMRDEWLIAMGRSSRGSAALIDAKGGVYAVSERFRQLVALEFGDTAFSVLPFTVPPERFDDPGPFQVRSLHFRIKPEGGLFLINARRPHPLDVLSPREQEIARALALGKTFKSVAREFEIAISTVANHASRIYRKLGIYRREELVELLRKAVDSKAA
ncbi:helix-turn-helix transcriptional regulator [Solimonas soli]|uniref:helix-turn-helix transcriptional regulator n=1 Tax=Solimonas soli TaxID=413479 RepID=UPI000488A863|nr:LuxR C-terminal-related transcriptional regulator [Solimonas soli]